jgi:LacI family transcriptional regulator
MLSFKWKTGCATGFTAGSCHRLIKDLPPLKTISGWRKGMNRVTINDVAKRAGVSKSTVSHVINQTRFVEESTKDKVLLAIQELGYRPSGIARSLVSRRTKTAGLLISDVSNPYYPDVILGVEEVALANDYSIFLCNTSYDLDRGMNYIQSLIDKSVDGILFMSSSMSMEMLHEAVKNQIQAVVLDWGYQDLEELAVTITINFRHGIRAAIKHLVDLGHRNIAHVCGPLDLWTSRVRRDEFINALADFGLDARHALVIEGNLRIDGGRKALDSIIQQNPRPSAIFAANDLTALGIIWAARGYGLNLPEQLSVVGLDDIDLASKVNPALTTVALPRNQIGKLAMSMLLDLIEHSNGVEKRKLEVGTSLVIRQSTTYPASV